MTTRRGFLGLFGISAAGVVVGLRPESPAGVTPTPTDQLRVKIGETWYDTLVVPSQSQEPPSGVVASGRHITIGEMKPYIFNAALPKIVMRGRVEIGE